MKEKLIQNLKISSTFTAALVGAGFASGQEILLFFGGKNVVTVFLAAIFIALFCYIFLELGRLTQGNIFSTAQPTFALCFNHIIKLINLIILAAMAAGSEYIIYLGFGIVGGGAVALMLSCACVLLGAEGIKLINTIIVPIMIMLILTILFTAGGKVILQGNISIKNAITYAGMNLISGGYLISIMAKNTDKGQCKWIAVFSFMQVLILLVPVYAAVNLCADSIMPLVGQAYKHGLGLVGIVVVFLALFTSMVSALAACTIEQPNKTYHYAVLGFLISLFGFYNLVNNTYMPIGAVGFSLTICCLFYLARLSLRSRYQQCKLSHF